MVHGKLPRGKNVNFICTYLAQHGPSRASEVLKALGEFCGLGKPHDGCSYFYWAGGVVPPRRGLRFTPGYNYRTGQTWFPKDPLWYQLTKRGPWALTLAGRRRALQILTVITATTC